jgi:hypothetical protein
MDIAVVSVVASRHHPVSVRRFNGSASQLYTYWPTPLELVALNRHHLTPEILP